MHHVLALLFLVSPLFAQSEPLTSGRTQPPEQACYDVVHYALEVKVDPAAHSIEGRVAMLATLLAETDALVLDLDDTVADKLVGTVRHPQGTHPIGRPLTRRLAVVPD